MSIVLSIETSCDETSCALVSENAVIIEATYTQIIHADYGGVVPEIAARDHLKKLPIMVNELLKNYHGKEISAIAYTNGPGLAGCLLVGKYFSLGLARYLNLPLYGIHHLEGHIMSSLLNKEDGNWSDNYLKMLPSIILIVSGGHSLIFKAEKCSYTLLSESVDDAAGEVFDKIARLLGLPYPGGSALSDLAIDGDVVYKLPKPMLDDDNMSFSGLKTAARILWEKILKEYNNDPPLNVKKNFAASVQYAIIDTLFYKVTKLLALHNLKKVIIVGGVSANILLRKKLTDYCDDNDIDLIMPPLKYCTDNAAMIGVTYWVKQAFLANKKSDKIILRSPLQWTYGDDFKS